MTVSVQTGVETTARTIAKNPVAQRTLDGGYSGELSVTRARSHYPENDDLIFVEAELMNNYLLLTRDQATALASALLSVTFEEGGQA